jgi:hypothetical protein
MNITVDQIMEWKPCKDWPRVRIEKLFGGRGSIPLVEILECMGLFEFDRIWVGCHALPETRWTWVDRARLYAADAMEDVGLQWAAEALRSLPQVVDETTARDVVAIADHAAIAAFSVGVFCAVDATKAAKVAAYTAYAACDGRTVDAAFDAANVCAACTACAVDACNAAYEKAYDEEIQQQLDILIALAKEKEES